MKKTAALIFCIPFAVIAAVCMSVPGFRFSALVCACIIAVIVFYVIISAVGRNYPRFSKWSGRIFTVLLCLGITAAGITEAFVIHASRGSPEQSCEYIVVLGAKVNPNGPSLSLQNRIDGAYEYLTAHPETTAVVSGGQGNDEHMTEAECMYQSLVSMGIEPERIRKEDKASSTWENINFTLDLIEEETGTRPQKLGIVSSEYHLFRAGLFAESCGIESVGIPAHTTLFPLKINYFMREAAGVWHYILLGGHYNA